VHVCARALQVVSKCYADLLQTTCSGSAAGIHALTAATYYEKILNNNRGICYYTGEIVCTT